MTYVAPIKDIRFVLEELLAVEETSHLPTFADTTPDVVAAIVEEAAKFAGEVIAPLNWPGDRAGVKWTDGEVATAPGFKEAYAQFVEAGWNGAVSETHYGGMGLPWIVNASIQEMFQAANMSFGLCPLLTQGAIEALAGYASQPLRDTYLANMVAGTWTGTMNLTEPQAGSDLAAVRTKAQPAGDHYLIKGQKIFITYGEHDMAENIIHLVLARLPDAPEGVKGISLFVVPKFLVNADGSLGARNDLRCVSVEHKLGIHASPTCTMAFGDNAGAVGYLVGEANRGLEYMFVMMNCARLGVGLQGVGVADRAYQHALKFAQERRQGRAPGSAAGSPIIEHADIRRMLGVMRTQTEAARALAYTAARSLDFANHSDDAETRARHQRRVDILIPVVKGWSTEMAIEVASLGVQIHGGMGFIEETGAAQHLRDARITTIYEGTTGIQSLDLVGRKILRDRGAAARELVADLRASAAAVAGRSGETWSVLAATAGEAADIVEELTGWLLASNDPARPGAAAVNILHAFGLALGAWRLVDMAAIAQTHLDAGDGDTAFCETKLASALFYALQVFPAARARRDAVTKGTDAVLALTSKLLTA
ncbi:MAG: acyl-CoA dehydrogenase [Hyphomicrobiaceae bacterium]|nr:acyl-CoA dehydrogenase [Hyphomicrobiaceae bacterium]